jgi:hypothetical protein
MKRRTFLTKCEHFHVSLVWLSQYYFRLSVATPSKFARGRKPNGVTSAIFKRSGRLYSDGKFMFNIVIDNFFRSQVFWRWIETEHSQLINGQWDLMLKPFCAGWMSQLGLKRIKWWQQASILLLTFSATAASGLSAGNMYFLSPSSKFFSSSLCKQIL